MIEDIKKEDIILLKHWLAKSLTQFIEKPLGDIESDLCDWNSPKTLAKSYTPLDIQKIVVERVLRTLDTLYMEPDK